MQSRFIVCCLLLLFAAVSGFGQVVPVTDEIKKGELFVGYSLNWVDLGTDTDFDDDDELDDFFEDRKSFQGFNVAGTYNVNRSLGIRGDFSAHFADFDVNVPALTPPGFETYSVDGSIYNFLGGVQVKDNRAGGSRFRPFGYAMAGVAHAKADVESTFFTGPFCSQVGIDCEDFDDSETGFAAAVGGGVDVRLSERFSIRAIQVDWNPNRLGGSWNHNYRVGFGVVIH